MSRTEETLRRLAAVPELDVRIDEPLSAHTRFGIGGPADILVQTSSVSNFIAALGVARSSGLDCVVIGGGTNLIVSDEGYRGIVLKFTAESMDFDGTRVRADAGAVLWDLVDFTVDRGLQGLETMAAIPGSVGAAIYGNAGAYGHSISESAQSVEFFDGSNVRTFSNVECQFHYRESIFKRKKDWIIFSVTLDLQPADPGELRKIADAIVKMRNEKFPPTMKCAGSIFKNFLLANLPARVAQAIPAKVVREGKVPSAYFLEQVNAKGMEAGDIHVAAYHANLIYNAGHGTAADLVSLIAELKNRVRDRFGIEIEEEVQYVGFEEAVAPV